MLRTSVIRGTLFLLLVAVGVALWWAQSYVRPEAVLATVIDSFADQFPDAHVQVAEAHLRVFGGVSVRDLRLARSGDDLPFFVAPTAIIAHDKEQLANGRMVIRRIELDGPTLRLERRADGRWTFDGLSRPSPADKAVPMFVVTHGTIVLTDKSQSGLPPLTFEDASFTLINDPPPLYLNVKGSALLSAPVAGTPMVPVRVDVIGRIHRLTGEFTFRVQANDVAIGPDLAALLRAWQPQIAERLTNLTAKASVKAELAYKPDAIQPLTYDVELNVREGKFSDPRLPVPVEGIDATIRFRDGKLTVEKATAKLGTSVAEVTLETRTVPAVRPIPPASGKAPATLASTVRNKSLPVDPLCELENHLEKFDLTLKNLTLDEELFRRLGEALAPMRKRFNPVGTVAVSYHFSRPSPQGWRRDFELKPTRFGMTYEKFRYPLTDLTGSIHKTFTSAGGEETTIDLTGSASGQRVDIKGTVRGSGDDPAIDIRLSGNNVPIDDRLFDSFPKLKHQQALKKLRAVGRGDFVAEVKQELDVNLTESSFRFRVYDVKFCPTQFAYPLENLTGQVLVNVNTTDESRPLKPGLPLTPMPDTDRVVLSDFTGKHGTGTVTFKGVHAHIPNEPDSKFTLHVAGQACPIDADFRAALAGIKLDGVWTTFSPRGTMTFAVDVDVIQRTASVPMKLPPPFDPHTPPGLRGTLTARPKTVEAPDPPFNPATDLKMTLNFTGPSITPDFFPYDLDALAGRVRYDGTQVRIEKFTANHGGSLWGLDAGEVRFFKDGRVWANLGKLDVVPLSADEDFLKALPGSLQKAVREMKLRGPAELSLRHLVVLTPPDAPQRLPIANAEPLLRPSLLGRGGGGFFASHNSNPNAKNPPPPLPKREGSEMQIRAQAPTEPDPDIYWTGELKLNGASLDAGVEWNHVVGRVASTGRYYGTHLGEVVGNVWLDEAVGMDQPFKNVKISYRADPQVSNPYRSGEYEPVAVKIADITGLLFGGTVGGEARITLSDPVRYRLRLDATEVNIADVAKHHNIMNARVEGTGQASLRIESVPDRNGQYTLDGAGTVDVDHAHILNLPFLLPLLKTLKLQAPDKTAFDEAHATFTIHGDRLHVTHLDLLGDAVSIGGSGDLDLAGKNVKFECYTIWSQTLQRWLTTPFGDVTAFLSEKLFRIEITTGPDGKLKYDAKIVPFMTDPVRAVADRMKKRKQALSRDVGALQSGSR